jgi:hypothetical protein
MVGNLFPYAAIFFENRFHSKKPYGFFRVSNAQTMSNLQCPIVDSALGCNDSRLSLSIRLGFFGSFFIALALRGP